ncbi:hypothetical protein HWV62_27901 [Athelia sp. TMB]|nr:hypothetical protein HWV62_27901 [Athelia sp. TMB]
MGPNDEFDQPSFVTSATGNAIIYNVAGHYIIGDHIAYRADGEEVKEICRWLAAPDTSKNFHAARETCHTQSGGWFILGERFMQWKEHPDRPLWVYGSPIEDIIGHCQERPFFARVYFFFDGRNAEGELSYHEKFIRSSIMQLWEQSGGNPAALIKIYGRGPSHPQPSLHSLEITLQAIIDEFRHVYIIVDAVDECVDRGKFLKWLKLLGNTGRVHVLFSSRQERDIEDHVAAFRYLDHMRFAGGAANPDISKYLKERLDQVKKWTPETRELVWNVLLEGADGSQKALKAQLQALPKDLQSTYERLFSKSDSPEDLRTFLQWAALSARPITLDELAEAIVVNFQSEDSPCYDADCRYMDPRDALTVCSGFVTEYRGTIAPLNSACSMTNLGENSGVVKLAHMSVKDYLFSERITKGPACYFSLNAKVAHSVIAETCLAYLLHFGTLISLSGAEVVSFPLARYAAEYWPSHLRSCGNTSPSESLQTLLSHFFLTTGDAYANWMWLIYTRPRWDWLMPPVHKIWKPAEKRRLAEDISTPLYVASLLGQHALVNKLLVQANHLTSERRWYHKALQGAAYEGHYEVVGCLSHHAPRLRMQLERYGGAALIVAASRGHGDIVDNLLRSGVDANASGWLPPESMTMRRGHEAIMKIFLRDGVDVNTPLEQYSQALPAASNGGYHRIVRSLLLYGGDIGACGEDGETPLNMAARQGYQEVVKLLKRGELLAALNLASANGKLDEVRRLLEYRANSVIFPAAPSLQHSSSGQPESDPDATRHELATPLLNAARGGHRDIFTLLLKASVAVEGRDQVLRAGFREAFTHGHENILEALLENGADVNAWAGSGAVHKALSKGHTSIARVLIANGSGEKMRGSGGGVSLHFAASLGDEALVRLLLKHGAEPDFAEENGATALHIASFKGHISVVKCLLSSGAGVNLPTNDGLTALHLASWQGHEDLVLQILGSGANPQLQNSAGQTALHTASRAGHEGVVRSLLEYGTHLDTRQANGNTSLILGAASGHEAVVRLLLESGADPNVRGDCGATALHVASSLDIDAVQQWRIPDIPGQTRQPEQQDYSGDQEEDQGFLYREDTWKVEDGRYSAFNVFSTTPAGGTIAFDLPSMVGAAATTKNKKYKVATQRQEAILVLLHAKGANINAQDDTGDTGLHKALKLGRKDVARWLLEHGCDPTVPGDGAQTALDIALRSCYLGVLSCMLANGAASSFQNAESPTAARLAPRRPDKEALRIALEFRFAGGNTALHLAAIRGDNALKRFLLDHGANVEARNAHNKTALDLISSREFILAKTQRGTGVWARGTWAKVIPSLW